MVVDFIAQSKCYRQVYEDDVDKCESGDKCLPYKTNMISFIHEKMRRADNISLEDGIEYVTSNLCQLAEKVGHSLEYRFMFRRNMTSGEECVVTPIP
uniref:Uncharacterized protein n=1 Tax=Romanomermis culicivorax TaxID=13658 RepID=A0A915L8T9_ROMCU